MISLAEQKYHIIHLIFSIDNPGLLNWVEQELRKKQKEAAAGTNGSQATGAAPELRSKLNRPLRQALDPAMLKKAQGWKGHDEAALMEAIRELNVEEPIEKLLAQLSK
jgi:hypothetical protein